MAKGYSARRGFSNGAGQAAQQMQMQQKLMQMQQEMAKAQQEVEEATFTASVGGGAVSAAANGKKEITALTIKPEAVDPDDVEGMANAMKKILADEHLRREMIEKGKEYVVRFDPKTLADEMNAVYLKCFDDKTFTEDRFVQTSSNKRTKISHYLPFF